MKSILKTLVIIYLMVVSTSCNDFLTEEPKGQLASDYFFQSAADLEASLHMLYQHAHYLFASEYEYGIINWMGDDIASYPTSVSMGAFDRYEVANNNGWAAFNWQCNWVVIKNANYIINNAGNTPGVSQEDIDYTLAQAHFWRAYVYFYLVNTWGPLPLMLESEVNYNATLTPVAEIFDLIVSDLKIAEGARINYTKAPFLINGRNRAVTQAAAKSALSYVYMSMAGWPLNKGTEYYQLAAAKAKEVIDGVENGTYNYELLDEHWKVNSMTYDDNHPEAILAAYYNKEIGYPNNIVCADYHPDMPGGWGNSHAEIKFWYDFPDGPRKESTYFPKQWINGVLRDWWWDTDPPSRPVIGPCFMKHLEGAERFTDYDWTDPRGPHDWNGDKSVKLILLSQVYCWYAEAVGRSGQTNAKAVEVLNKVRNRADGAETNIYSASMTASELAEAAYNEHGWESAGNYMGFATRYWDMFRMYRVKDHFEYRQLNPMIEVAPGIFMNQRGTPVTGTWNDNRMYLPYPDTEVMLNPNLKR